MRVFALSDVHVDYPANADWIVALSTADYQNDILLVAGDISDDLRLLAKCLTHLERRFRKVLYVPGNHDLWVVRHDRDLTSLSKFYRLCRIMADCGVSMRRHDEPGLSIVPLLAWYDFSFGLPSEELKQVWTDFTACRWPDDMTEEEVTTAFLARNPPRQSYAPANVITFSHFLPRAELLPLHIRPYGMNLHPVLGTTRLDDQVRAQRAKIHVYGHSHVNRRVEIDGVIYCNNALGYPNETAITSRTLGCVYGD